MRFEIFVLPPALTGLARIDVARGELGSAAARLRRSTDRLPPTSSLVLLSEVEGAIGRRRAARADLAAARTQHRLLRGSRTLPDAEAVLFEANHGSRGGPCCGTACVEARAEHSKRRCSGMGAGAGGAAACRRCLGTARPSDGVGRSAVPAARRRRCARSGLRAESERYLTAAVRGSAALSPASLRLLAEARS